MAFEFETHRIRKYEPCKNTGEEQPARRTACAKAQGQERANVCEEQIICAETEWAMWAGVGHGPPGLDESLDPARLPMEVVVGKIGVI